MLAVNWSSPLTPGIGSASGCFSTRGDNVSNWGVDAAKIGDLGAAMQQFVQPSDANPNFADT